MYIIMTIDIFILFRITRKPRCYMQYVRSLIDCSLYGLRLVIPLFFYQYPGVIYSNILISLSTAYVVEYVATWNILTLITAAQYWQRSTNNTLTLSWRVAHYCVFEDLKIYFAYITKHLVQKKHFFSRKSEDTIVPTFLENIEEMFPRYW